MHYRSLGSIQAYQVVLADSHEIPRAPHYSGTHPHADTPASTYPALTVYGPPSQTIQLHTRTHAHPRQKAEQDKPHNPPHATPAGLNTHKV